MQEVKKVEIIVSSLELDEVIQILDTIKVSGYTVIKNTYGKGDRGVSYNDLGREFSNTYIMTVCTNEKQLFYLVDELLPVLKRVGGVCLVTESQWLSH